MIILAIRYLSVVIILLLVHGVMISMQCMLAGWNQQVQRTFLSEELENLCWHKKLLLKIVLLMMNLDFQLASAVIMQWLAQGVLLKRKEMMQLMIILVTHIFLNEVPMENGFSK